MTVPWGVRESEILFDNINHHHTHKKSLSFTVKYLYSIQYRWLSTEQFIIMPCSSNSNCDVVRGPHKGWIAAIMLTPFTSMTVPWGRKWLRFDKQLDTISTCGYILIRWISYLGYVPFHYMILDYVSEYILFWWYSLGNVVRHQREICVLLLVAHLLWPKYCLWCNKLCSDLLKFKVNIELS